MSTKLYYNKFKNEWLNALPLGNGKIAAMLYGNPDTEQIQINEESLWSGSPLLEKYETSPEIMNEIRELLFNEEYEKAREMCDKYFLAKPARVRFYQTFGDIFIDFSDKTEAVSYKKELELSTAVASVSYKKGETQYLSECFVSEKYNVLCYHIKTKNGEKFSFDLKYKRENNNEKFDSQKIELKSEKNKIFLKGQIIDEDFSDAPIADDYGIGGENLKFAAEIAVKTDGEAAAQDEIIKVENATEAFIFGAFETEYDVNTFDFDRTKSCPKIVDALIEKALSADFSEIKDAHIKDHGEKFERVSLELSGENFDNIPTDERLEAIKNGKNDFDFYTLYFNFGRYLLLASSGGNAVLPANLQGKWCHEFYPPWGSDYHTNINLQMNYWPAYSANLSETAKPLIHFMEMLAKFGEKTAREMYHTDGWVIHHTTDIYGKTGVHDYSGCGFFPMAGPWMCMNLWEEYEYNNDSEYLKNTLYPIMKGSCEFLKGFLIEDKEGNLVTNPSNSPENIFYYTDKNGEKKKTMFTYGATIDFEIIYALFTRTIYAAELLETDAEFVGSLKEILKRIPPLRISKRYGTIQEWIKDYEEAEPNHRHISHLFGLHPSDQINEQNPEIFETAKKTIARRLEHGGGATGWSRAWIINFYSRLLDGENASEHLKQLLIRSTAENLFDMHPPFQIDGNFGGCAGIAEMLLQSHLGEIGNRTVTVLPAIPKAWKSGSFKGLCARGGFVVDAKWENGVVVYLKVHSKFGGKCKIRVNGEIKEFETQAEKSYDIEL